MHARRPVPAVSTCSPWSSMAPPDPKLSLLSRDVGFPQIAERTLVTKLRLPRRIWCERYVHGSSQWRRTLRISHCAAASDIRLVFNQIGKDNFSEHHARDNIGRNSCHLTLAPSLKLVCKANARSFERATEMCVTVLFEANRDVAACFCQRAHD